MSKLHDFIRVKIVCTLMVEGLPIHDWYILEPMIIDQLTADSLYDTHWNFKTDYNGNYSWLWYKCNLVKSWN